MFKVIVIPFIIFLHITCIGCGGKRVDYEPARPTIPEVVSPTIHINQALKETEKIQINLRDLILYVNNLKTNSIETVKPVLMDKLNLLHTQVMRVEYIIKQAAEVSVAADNSILKIKELLDSEINRRVVLEKRNVELVKTIEEFKTDKLNKLSLTAIGIGMVAVVIGGLMLYFLTPKTSGFIVLFTGCLGIAVGLALWYFKYELAFIGLVVVVVGIIAGFIFTIKRLRDDSKSIILGVQQAIDAGKLDIDAVAPYFNKTQTPGARKLVDTTVG